MNKLARLARDAQHIVAFTGAGMSTESGIPDYRGPGGVWARNAPPTLQDFVVNEETRRRYWQERRLSYPALRETRPNSGHLALSRLSDAGLLATVITQNIDGLHQMSGIPRERVIELHGSAHKVRCLDCAAIYSADEIQELLELEPLPTCQNCGGPLRSATILFGEPLSPTTLRRAIDVSSACDLMLIVGSSLIAQPAARLPAIAAASGAKLVIVNNEPTPLDPLATLVVRASAGQALTEFADALLTE